MSATIVLAESKSFSLRHFLLQHLVLGVPVAIWAWALLLLAIAAYFDAPVVAFDGQELTVPF
jgi:hypothetical protein